MSELALTILQPANNSAFNDGDAVVPLQGQLVGDGSGLYFKWYSSLNSVADENHPELNRDDHSAGILNWSSPLLEFGSHVITLVAADQDANDIDAVKAITRSAMAGGAPPAAPAPCVIHRLKAQIHAPAAEGHLSRAGCILEVLAPLPLLREEPPGSNTWVRDTDYLALNGIEMKLRLAPQGPADPAHTAEIPLPLALTPFFRADGQSWLRRSGALPGNVKNGSYALSLIVSAGSKTETATRNVVLIN